MFSWEFCVSVTVLLLNQIIDCTAMVHATGVAVRSVCKILFYTHTHTHTHTHTYSCMYVLCGKVCCSVYRATTMLPLCYHYATTMLPLCYHRATIMLCCNTQELEYASQLQAKALQRDLKQLQSKNRSLYLKVDQLDQDCQRLRRQLRVRAGQQGVLLVGVDVIVVRVVMAVMAAMAAMLWLCK